MAENTAMTLKEAQDFAERLADRDANKMEFIGGRRWDAYRYVVPAVIAALGLLKPEPKADVAAVRAILHASASGKGASTGATYLDGSFDDTPQFVAALEAYRATTPTSR